MKMEGWVLCFATIATAAVIVMLVLFFKLGTENELLRKMLREANESVSMLTDMNRGMAAEIDKRDAMMKLMAEELEESRAPVSRGDARDKGWDIRDLTKPSGFTLEDCEAFLSDCDPRLLAEARTFLDAERLYGINAAFLMAVARHESGNGDYPYMEQNNCFSWKGNGPGGYAEFITLDQCIRYVASRLDVRMGEAGAKSLYEVHDKIWHAESITWPEGVLSVVRGEGYGDTLE